MTEHLVGFSRWKEGDGLVHHAIGDYFPYRYMAGVDETKVETWKTWTLQGPSGPITARHIALAFHETQSVANPLLADNGGFMTVEDPRAPGSLMVCSPWDPGNVVKSVTKYGPPVLEALLQNYHWSLRVSGIAYCSPAKCERLCAKVDQ